MSWISVFQPWLAWYQLDLTCYQTRLWFKSLVTLSPFPPSGSYLDPLPGLLRLFLVSWPLSISSKGGTAQNLKQVGAVPLLVGSVGRGLSARSPAPTARGASARGVPRACRLGEKGRGIPEPCSRFECQLRGVGSWLRNDDGGSGSPRTGL